jgi:tetratricopeptide (TPR) repeat protein
MQLDPRNFEAPLWLSILMRRAGNHREALGLAERALSLNEQSPEVQNQLGSCLLSCGQMEAAVQCFRNAIVLNPRSAPFYDNLGNALRSLGKTEEAVAAYRQALTLEPDAVSTLFRLGDLLATLPDPPGVESCAQAILRLEPQSPQGNLLLARALISDGRVEEGAKYALKASRLAPKSAAPVAYYGRALQSLGKIEDADVQFKRALELEPKQGFAYHALVHNHKVTEDERQVVHQMEQLVRDGSLPTRELIQLEYGLGKAHGDLGDYELSMRHFDRANLLDHELKIGVAPFDPKALSEHFDLLIEMVTQEFLEANRSEERSDRPIFVVGMMRSGTTLAEQILSSHGQVGGVGEQLFWPTNAGLGEKLLRNGVLDTPKLNNLAALYLEKLEGLAPGMTRVVDKMNTNYILLGFLHLAYPNAKIVHMKRNPLDTCLSIWATPVAQGVDLCGSKENVVAAYEQYARLMKHYRSVLPDNRLLEVQYEDLVSDQEAQTRRMTEFCGLPWDEACLRPQENERSVRTPSVWQVRQPVYKTSMARWKRYEPWLGAFEKLRDLEV